MAKSKRRRKIKQTCTCEECPWLQSRTRTDFYPPTTEYRCKAGGHWIGFLPQQDRADAGECPLLTTAKFLTFGKIEKHQTFLFTDYLLTDIFDLGEATDSELEHAMKTSEKLYDLRTHNGTITVLNPETGQHRTFRIRTEEWTDKSTGEKSEHRVVSVLAGPNNEDDFVNFGFLVNDGSHISVWGRLRGQNGERSDYQRFAKILCQPEHFARTRGLEFNFAGRCRKCNRTLTTPDSVRDGIGPVCKKKELERR